MSYFSPAERPERADPFSTHRLVSCLFTRCQHWYCIPQYSDMKGSGHSYTSESVGTTRYSCSDITETPVQ